MAKNRLIRVIECGGELRDVTWSRDGTRLAVTRYRGPMEVFTTEGRTLWTKGPDGQRFTICWSPDGRSLAAVQPSHGMEIVDAATGEVLRTFEHPSPAHALDWSRDGSLLATGANDGWVRLWSPVTGLEVTRSTERSDTIWSVAFSPDGQWIASGSMDAMVRIWNARTGALAHRLEGHRGPIRPMAWSPDGRHLASPGEDKTIRIWDTATGQCLRVLEGQASWTHVVDWSCDGRLLASGSADVRLWWLDEERETMILEGHGGDVWSVAFSPEGGRLASCSDDGTVRLWSVEDLVQPVVSQSVSSALSDFVRRQAATVGRRVRGAVPDLWVPHLVGAQGDCLGEIRLEGGRNDCAVAVSPDGKSMVVGSSEGHMECWDLVTGQNRWSGQEQHSRNILDLSYSSDGLQIVSVSMDQAVRIWDAVTGQCRRIYEGHCNFILAARWAPEGRRIASASGENEGVHIWEPATGQCLRTLGHSDTWGIDWSPDGRYLVSGGWTDHLLRIWDGNTGQQLREMRGHGRAVYSVAWSPARPNQVASASGDTTIRIWDPHTGAELHRLQGHQSTCYCLAWSPDGRFLASGSADNTIRIWDAASGRELACFVSEGRPVWRLAWSRSGAFLASSQFGNIFRLWETCRFSVAGELSSETDADFTAAPEIRHPLPRDLAALPRAWAALHRLGRSAPLSLTRDLLQLTGGQSSGLSADLAAEPGIRRLAQLKWPTSARVGLAGLLLKEARFEGWEPPEDSRTGDVAAALQSALASGEPMPPELPEETWLAPMRHAVRQIDERLVNLLRILGPDAVTADPGLPLRLWPRVGQLPALSVAQQRLLGRSLSLGEDGRTSGSGGGTERTGIDHRGELTRLLPSQWALPRSLVQFRYVRQELLYRSREGSETPRLRPVVLVLDVSPPVYGAVEAVTRLAADTVARSLRQAGVGVMLVTTGSQSGGEVLLRLEQPAHCVEIWTQRTRAMARAARTLKLAGTVRSQLREGELEPVILVLSHPWFGSEEEAPKLSGLRGLFVQYPKYQVRPVLADRCERWHSIAAGETTHLLRYLGDLVG